MIKKLIVLVMTVSFVFMLGGGLNTSNIKLSDIAKADTTVGWDVSAVVPSGLEITGSLFLLKSIAGVVDIDWDSSPTSVDFGTLVPVTNVDDEFLYMSGANAYAAVLVASTSGKKYSITQTGSDITSGGDKIPAGAYILSPDYQEKDVLGTSEQGACPGIVAAPKSAVGADQFIYTSDLAGKAKLIRAFLSIGGPDANGEIANYSQGHNGATGIGAKQLYEDTWEPVTGDQPAGTYSATISFTVNLI